MTSTVIESAVTPTSVAFGVSLLHLSEAPDAVVVVPPAVLLLSLRPQDTAIIPKATRTTTHHRFLFTPFLPSPPIPGRLYAACRRPHRNRTREKTGHTGRARRNRPARR